MQKVFLNDKMIDADKAGISVTDGGFLYGAGLFETMRSCGGVVFRLEDHISRLLHSAKALSIDHQYDEKYLTAAVYDTIKENGLSDARLRLTLTSGPISESQEDRKATLLISAVEFQSYPADYYSKGTTAVLCPFRQNPADPTCGHKTTNYYTRILGLNMARRSMATEALWFTTDNRLAEGCISNVFLVKDSIVYTPPTGTPVLAGVARKAVLHISGQDSIDTSEKDLYIADLLGADEVFVTNVIMQVMPIVAIEKHTVGDGKVGTVTQKLQKLFQGYVKEQTKDLQRRNI